MLLPEIKLPVSPELAQWAKWRVWAAEVRDRNGRHRLLPKEVAERAAILARMMDALDHQLKRVNAPSNMTMPLEGTILAIFGWLFLKGVGSPE